MCSMWRGQDQERSGKTASVTREVEVWRWSPDLWSCALGKRKNENVDFSNRTEFPSKGWLSWNRSAAPSQWEESVEVFQAWMPQISVFPGRSGWRIVRQNCLSDGWTASETPHPIIVGNLGLRPPIFVTFWNLNSDIQTLFKQWLIRCAELRN